MTAASQDPKEEHDFLDDLIGKEPEDHPDDDPSNDIGEGEPASDEPADEEPEPVEAKEDAPEADELDDEEEDDDEEPGNLRLPAKEEAEPGDETKEDEPVLSDADQRLAAEQKRSAGLQKELARIRAKQAELSAMQAPQQYAPPAPPPIAAVPDPATPAIDPNRIPVVVSEDGQSVYVDQDKLAAQMKATARSEYEEANRPTPDQISAHNERQMAASFISQDRERNEPIYKSARDAESFIFEAVTTAAESQGLHFESPQDVQSFIHQSGIGKQVEEFFPDVAPLMDEFVAAGMADNATWKKSVLDRMGPSETPEIPSGVSGELESVGGAPRSLARKGASRSTSSNTDEAEFLRLEKSFQEEPFEMSDKLVKKMEALGKKLGITGME